jgi:EmrB/QacA subfamily drug resistance transporter
MNSLRTESRLVALLVATAFFMQGLDTSIMNTSLPQMARSFQVIPLDLSLGITVYTLTAAALVPLSGWLADRFGARLIFIISIAVFTVASLMCGVANNLWQFGVARVLQGMGGALMMPVGRAIVLRNAEKHELLHVTALITWPALMAPIIGPVLGGFITTYITWRWNFLLNVPLGAIGILLILRHVPNIAGEHRHAFDWTGFVFCSSALVAMLYGLESLSHAQINWAVYQWLLPSLLMLVGVGFSVLSVQHFNHTPRALLELSSLSVQTFRIASFTAGLAFRLTINATPYLLPLLFQLGFGLNALQAGSLLVAYFIGNLAIKPATTPILKTYGFRNILIVNGLLAGASIMACALLNATTATWIIMAMLFAAGATRSMQLTCLNSLAFADTTPAQRSSSTTMFSMFNQAAAALGVATSTLVVNLSLLSEHRTEAGLREIRYGLIVIGLIGLVSSLSYLRLPTNAGADVTGYRG